jgi:hypothetical protein
MAVSACLFTMSCSGAGRASSIVEKQEILLVPPIVAGWAGWCMTTSPGGGCAAGRSRPPIIAETWESSSAPAVTVGYALTTSQVGSVSVEGRSPLLTHADRVLPDGLRTVVIEIPGLNPEHELLPHFTPLNAKGYRMPQPPGLGNEIRHGTLASGVPIRNVKNPAHPTSGVCRIRQARLVGLTAQEGSVITVVKAYSGLIGRGFVSCASTSYNLNGWPLLACTLLAAARPGMDPPMLPGIRSLPNHPGIFEAPGPEGRLLARRVHGGWLVAARAKFQQRLTLIEHLHVTVQV